MCVSYFLEKHRLSFTEMPCFPQNLTVQAVSVEHPGVALCFGGPEGLGLWKPQQPQLWQVSRFGFWTTDSGDTLRGWMVMDLDASNRGLLRLLRLLWTRNSFVISVDMVWYGMIWYDMMIWYVWDMFECCVLSDAENSEVLGQTEISQGLSLQTAIHFDGGTPQWGRWPRIPNPHLIPYHF